MTEQELREKIVEIMYKSMEWEKHTRYTCNSVVSGEFSKVIRDFISDDLEFIADALTAAGIGDVSEYKHRAEVAERALKSRALCHVLQYLSCEPDILKSCIQEVYEAWIYQAEKELAEEVKR